MQVFTTTKAREKLSDIVNYVRFKNRPIAIGRRNKIEVIIIKYPEQFNKKIDDITHFNAGSGAFDFLADEPDIYGLSDLKKSYV
ncbi:MAG: hypothetical protein ABH896_02565 [Candidatus Jacksonbacteria bacterium]